MKLLLVLLFLFSTDNFLFAQYDYGYGNNKELIKTAKVKTLSVYYFKSESDSILTHVNSYDSLGNSQNTIMYGSDGNIVSSNTFIYNEKHLVIKLIHSNGSKIIYESTFTYNASGKILNQVLSGDSLHLQVINSYDEHDRIIKSINYDNTGDTTIINTFYNRKNFVEKSIIWNRQNGTTVTAFDYNAKGKMVKHKTISPDSRYLSTFKYNANGNNYEITTDMTTDKRKEFSKILYSFYTNGLTFTKIFFVNNKPINVEKTYYTYY